MSFRDWPRSATWDATGYYELPTPEPPIAVSDGSVSLGLLPTPTAREKGGANCRHGDTSRGDDLPEAVKYLPTPNASDGKGASAPTGRTRPDGRPHLAGDSDLPEAVRLLKTPTAQLAVNGGSQHPDKRRAGGHGPTLADQVEHQLLPTPMAADGDQASLVFPRGNATLIGSLLPTPRATDGTNGGPNQRGSSGDLMLPSAVIGLLPTPRATDTGTPGRRASEGFRPPLSQVLLPTPTSQNSHGNAHKSNGELLPPGLAVALSSGETTSPPSAAGKPSPAASLPGQLSLGEPESA